MACFCAREMACLALDFRLPSLSSSGLQSILCFVLAARRWTLLALCIADMRATRTRPDVSASANALRNLCGIPAGRVAKPQLLQNLRASLRYQHLSSAALLVLQDEKRLIVSVGAAHAHGPGPFHTLHTAAS